MLGKAYGRTGFYGEAVHALELRERLDRPFSRWAAAGIPASRRVKTGESSGADSWVHM